MAERLYRSREDRMLTGVAGGVADRFDADPSLVRIAWAILTIITGGLGLVVYIVMAIVVPEAPGGDETGVATGVATEPSTDPTGEAGPARTARRARRRDPADRGRGGLIAGLVLIVIGGFFLLRELVPWFEWRLWWPIGLILLGGLLLVLAILPRRSSE